MYLLSLLKNIYINVTHIHKITEYSYNLSVCAVLLSNNRTSNDEKKLVIPHPIEVPYTSHILGAFEIINNTCVILLFFIIMLKVFLHVVRLVF